MSENANSTMRKLLKPSSIIGILISVFIVGAFLSSLFVIDQTEQAVITRFGRYYKTVGAGLQTKLPFGIDRKYIVPGEQAVQTEQFGFRTTVTGVVNQYQNNITTESTMLTGDLNIVDVEWVIQYRISDAKDWLFSVQDRTKTIRDISYSVINELVGDRAILDIMSNERTNIQELAVEKMNEQFKKLELGITVTTVQFQNIVPPQGVQDAFEDVNKAIQDMNRFINEGKESYKSQIPKARGEAEQQLQIAKGYAAERVNRAKGDVARFNSVYEEYRKSPAITRERLYLETMNDVLTKSKPVLVDGEIDNMLPLKNLDKKTK